MGDETRPLSDERILREGQSEAAMLFFAAALPALLLYVLTLAPTVSAEDSGELITAAYTVGIAHPPGYPLWCMLGKLFTFLPLGTVAWRVNLLSAVIAALSVGLLALIARGLTRRFSVSLTAALVFAASRDFWGQSVIAEVYSLNVLLVLLMLWLVFKFDSTCRTRWLYLAAFTLGVGLTNHSTMGPLGPLFFAWVLFRDLRLLRQKLLLVNLGAAFLLGFSLILYLPIRSAADPVMDWGDPETLSATWDHLLRRMYTEDAEITPRTVARQATLIYHFLGTYAAQFTIPGALLSAFGIIECFRRRRPAFFLLAPLFLLTSYGFIWLLNYPPDRENLHLTRVFFLPAYAVGALFLALGLKSASCRLRLVARRAFPRGLKVAFATAAVSLVAFPLVFHFKHNDRSDDYLAYDWGRNTLLGLKPDAILLASSDHSTFPVLYLQAVEGLRPDVLNGNKYGYIEDRLFEEVFEGRDPPRARPPVGRSRVEKERFLVRHSGRPVYMTTKSDLGGLSGYELVSSGLVFEVVKTDGSEPRKEEQLELWEGMEFHPGSLAQEPGEFGNDLILSDYHYARGRFALLFETPERAVEEFRVAARYGEGIQAIHNNLGGALAESGNPREALPFLKRALTLDRRYDLAIRNIANCYYAMEAYSEGLRYFYLALELEPRNRGLQLAKARAYKERGKRGLARFVYESLLIDDPRNEDLWGEFEEFMTEESEKEAFVAFSRAVRKKPKVAKRQRDVPEPPRVPSVTADPHLPQIPGGSPQAPRPGGSPLSGMPHGTAASGFPGTNPH